VDLGGGQGGGWGRVSFVQVVLERASWRFKAEASRLTQASKYDQKMHGGGCKFRSHPPPPNKAQRARTGGCKGVGQVRRQERGGPGGVGLRAEARKRHHRQAAVLQLLHLELRHVALGVAQGVEDAAGVADLALGEAVWLGVVLG